MDPRPSPILGDIATIKVLVKKKHKDHDRLRPADVCLPFTVRVGEGVGRYVVATRDIKAGQVILMINGCKDEMARMMMMIMIITKIMIMIMTRMMMQVSELIRGSADNFSGHVDLMVMDGNCDNIYS